MMYQVAYPTAVLTGCCRKHLQQQMLRAAVPVSTIDIFAQQQQLNTINFIKIGVEGFEFKC